MAVCNLLEGNFAVFMVNAAHMKQVPWHVRWSSVPFISSPDHGDLSGREVRRAVVPHNRLNLFSTEDGRMEHRSVRQHSIAASECGRRGEGD
jgi:hypothetical protein